VLHSFGGSGDGTYPSAGLVNVNGTLYGTTVAGGAINGGTVFAITPSGTETVLHSFGGGSGDGVHLDAGLINVKGTLYGTTSLGGTSCARKGGCGTIFKVTPSGAVTVLHRFVGGSDGARPTADLLDLRGTLYGTTLEGGGGSGCFCGTVFAITTSGSETVLHSFSRVSGDGAFPEAGLINVRGKLYGTTPAGGSQGSGCTFSGGCGTVFAITPSGTETVLHSFGGSGDGDGPEAGLVNANGTLYGTTLEGGANYIFGTVFAITPSGTETVLHSFGGSGDGKCSCSGLVNVNGTLYGTTSGGGANGYGTVFAITPSGRETVLYSFDRSGDGTGPNAALINVKGTLYGTTNQGGANGYGTVFSITP
jgi:uncharacterized repeat protein (TIGR03803 family)